MKMLCMFLILLSLACTLSARQDAQPERAEGQRQETIITSDLFEMVGGETENYFYFKGDGSVTGTNLRATCDEMEVVADRHSSDEEKTVGKVGTIQSIVMTGKVRIEQSGRKAEAGRADILPREDKVILSENPRVIDSEGTVSGWRITLFKGERKALVEGNPDKSAGEGSRPRIQLPGFQDLGFEDKADASGEARE